MQIAFLRSFLGVARLGSVRKGAEDVNITPSAVSRHIAVLERVVGAPLFERRPRGMVLTPEGEILRKYAMRMVSSFDVVKSAVEEIRGLRLGVVRIHSIEAVTSSVLNPAIQEYVAAHAGISFQVEVVIRDNNDVIHALLRDETDIGIMYKLNINSDIEYLAEFPTPFAVIMSPSHRLASRETLSVKDLVGNAVAALHPSTATRRLMEEAQRAAGVQLDYTLVVNSFEMAKEFARTSVGVTILPAISARLETRAGSLVAVPLTEWTLSRVRSTICAHKNRPLPKAARDFIELLKERLKRAS
jgi:DNA-binding transcriptional LysR family regulator